MISLKQNFIILLKVFVKTMVLVVSLGLLHGLFVVPTFLCALSNLFELLCITRKVNFQKNL